MDAVDNATPMVGVTPALDDNLVNFDTEAAKVEEAPAEAVNMRSLEPPLRDSAPSQSAILGSPSKTRPSSVIATKNTRKRIEDRHVVLHDLKAYLPSTLQAKVNSEEHVSYYAVFDGHATPAQTLPPTPPRTSTSTSLRAPLIPPTRWKPSPKPS